MRVPQNFESSHRDAIQVLSSRAYTPKDEQGSSVQEGSIGKKISLRESRAFDIEDTNLESTNHTSRTTHRQRIHESRKHIECTRKLIVLRMETEFS